MSIGVESGDAFNRRGSLIVPVRVTVLDVGDSLNRGVVERRVKRRALVTSGILSETAREPLDTTKEIIDNKAEIVSRELVDETFFGVTLVADYLVRVKVDE